jgi:hypothetical protein
MRRKGEDYAAGYTLSQSSPEGLSSEALVKQKKPLPNPNLWIRLRLHCDSSAAFALDF